MGGWDLALPIGEDEAPLFARIARAVVDEIRRGRLRPGDALPGSRTLARALGVHRNTVAAAYAELAAEGWTESAPARAIFVSRALPEERTRAFAPPRRARTVGFDLTPAPADLAARERAATPARARYPLAGGLPDLSLVPSAALGRAYRRALRRGPPLLDYGDPRGSPRLRAALAEMLARARGLAVDESCVLVTRGSQMALWLAAHALCGPGDLVAIEALGYRPAWDAFRAAGARLEPLPIDRGGLRVDALAALCAERPPRAIYLTPHHQYPTTVTLTAPRRLELLRLARRHRFAVVEDDYDHEFHYQGRPVLPLASADAGGSVVYVGTLSKVLAPALRLGYLVAPPPLVERLAADRVLVDRQGDRVLEEAVAELLEEGEVQRHVRRARRIYHARRDVLAAELTARLGGRVRFALPTGGMALWCDAPGVDAVAWEARALAAGVGFQAARRFTFDGRARSSARLGFAPLDERAIAEAVRRLAATIDA